MLACAGREQQNAGVRFVGKGSKIKQQQTGGAGWNPVGVPAGNPDLVLYDERAIPTFAKMREERRPPILYTLPTKEGKVLGKTPFGGSRHEH